MTVDQTKLKAFDAFGSKGDAPEWILVARRGENKTTKGSFLVDDADAQRVMAQFAKEGNDLVVDYQHQTVPGHESPTGRAPAAGWIDELKWVTTSHDAPDGKTAGLWAHVRDWTPSARDMILDKEYRYLSPTVGIDRTTRRVTSLLSVALTNTPAMYDAPRLAASKETDMATLEELRAKAALVLGKSAAKRAKINKPLKDDADPVDLFEKFVEALADMPPTSAEAGAAVTDSVLPELWMKIGEAVGAEPGSSQEEILRMVLETLTGGGKPEEGEGDGEGDAPPAANSKEQIAMTKRLEAQGAQIAALQADVSKREFDACMSDWVKRALVTPGELKECHDDYLALHRDKPETLRRMIENRPAVVPHGRKVEGGGGGSDRAEVLRAAKDEWDNNAECKVSDLAAYTNDALREAGLAVLTADEEKTY